MAQSLAGVYEVVRLERVQNKYLWNKYCMYRSHVELKRRQAATVRTNDPAYHEELLFHGTRDTPVLDTIGANVENGFEPRLAKDAEYGAGTYFAQHAIYSVAYERNWLFYGQPDARLVPKDDPAGTKVVLLLARVALGQGLRPRTLVLGVEVNAAIWLRNEHRSTPGCWRSGRARVTGSVASTASGHHC